MMSEKLNPKRPTETSVSNLGKLLGEFPEWLNISGVKQACDSSTPWWWRGVWLAVILTGLAFPVYQICTQVGWYLSRPVSVRFAVKSRLVMPFPPVTFCSKNVARRSALYKLNMTHLTPYFDIYNAGEFRAVNGDTMDGLSKYNWTQIYRLLGHQLEDMLVKCTWKGQACGVDDFTITDTDHGPCFTFNRAEKKSVQVAGRGGALKMVLNVQQEEYLPSSVLAGVEVMLEERGKPPLVYDQSVNAPVGSWTSIVMHREAISRVEPPWENCLPVDHNSQQQHHYQTREMCCFICYVQEIIRNCSCRMSFMPEILPTEVGGASPPQGVKICNPVEVNQCALPVYYDIREGYDDCAAKCEIESCVQEGFEIMTSEAAFSRVYLQKISGKMNMTLRKARENLLGVEVFYREMKVEAMENTIGYSGIQLFCDIGGAMGLILGASLATVLEFVDVLFRDRLRAWNS